MATPSLTGQNFFSTTLTSGITSTDTTIPLNSLPTGSEGYLIIEPDNTSNREIIYYTSKTGSAVLCTSAALGRGVDGTTAVSHSAGATVKMVYNFAYWSAIQDTTALGSNYTQGWVPGSGTWTYASSSTFTVPSADAASMAVGTKIKMTNSGSKYFYVTGISGTTITVNGGSDYSVANAAITSPYFSNAETPQGFPQYFNYSPTWTNLTVGNGTVTALFSMRGKDVRFRVDIAFGTTTSISGAVSASLPVTAATYAGAAICPIGSARFEDTGTTNAFGIALMSTTTTARIDVINASSTYAGITALSSTVPFSWGSTDQLKFQADYQAA